MDVTAQALETALAQITPQIRPASADDAIAGVQPRVVVEPETEDEVAEILRYANAEQLAVIPRGGGSHLRYGAPPSRADIILSLTRLNHILEHAPHDLTVTAQAGATIADLQATLGTARQWLALDPPLDASATLGGVISTNVSGPRRLRYGGVRDQIIGVRVALADGTLARGGGKVVKNVAGYDLPKLFTGALGTLGVVVSASFRLYPLLDYSTTALLASTRLEALGAIALRILAAPLTPTALDLCSPAVPGGPYQLAVRFQSGVRAAITEQANAVCSPSVAEGADSHTLLVDADDQNYWEVRQRSVAEPLRTTDSATMVIKASLLPSEVVGWLAALESTCAGEALIVSWQAHAGHGLITARLSGSPHMVGSAVGMLRREALERRGSLVVTDLPVTLADAMDPWGPIPALAIMRQLKARFDPNGILNPGRFVGGI